MVWAALKISGSPLTPGAIVRAFLALNVALLVVGAWLWGGIARELDLSDRGFFVGAIALFSSFAAIKQAIFLPVLTDISALTFGLLIFLLYLREATLGLAIAAFFGGFTWPVLLPLSLPLLLWPRPVAAVASIRPVLDRNERSEHLAWGGWLAAIVAAPLIGLLLFLFILKGRRIEGMGPVIPAYVPLFPVSVVALALLAFFALREVVRGVDWIYIRESVRNLRPRSLLITVALVVASKMVLREIASPLNPPFLSIRTFLAMLAFTPATRPLITVVAHVAYLGPWILLLVMYWPQVCRAARALGPGLVAFVAISVVLGLLPESRQSLFSVPAFVALFAVATDRERWSRALLWGFAVASIILSKFWLTIGPADGSDLSQLRLYFINHGPYMDNAAYAAHGAAVLLLAVGFLGLRRLPGSLPNRTPKGLHA